MHTKCQCMKVGLGRLSTSPWWFPHRSRLSTASRYPVPVPLEISAPERRIHGIHGISSPSWPCATNVAAPQKLGPERWSTSPQARGTGCAHHGRSCLGPRADCGTLPCPKPLQTPKYDQTRQRAEPTNFQNLPKTQCLMVETPTVDRTFARY